MLIEKQCNQCGTAVRIEEIIIDAPELRSTMYAHCPNCGVEMHQGEVDGWFYVQTVETYQQLLSSNNLCVYPMP